MDDYRRGMKIEHILEKGSGSCNEDTLIMENNIFGVFDGASSLVEKRFKDQKTGGRLAAEIAGRVFAKNHYPLMHLGCEANTAILNQMKIAQVDTSRRHALWSASAAVARVTRERVEWFQTGDAYILIIRKDGSYFLPVEREDHDYETLLMLKKDANHQSRKFKNQVIKIRQQMNKTYGVLNGAPEAVGFLNTGSLPVKDIRTILLFTDGLSHPSRIPARMKNFRPLVSLYKRLGLSGLKNHIRKMESKDPFIRKFPRFKCHDDIAAIAIHPA